MSNLTQIESELLDIHDEKCTGEGGAPAWIVIIITGALFFIVAAEFVVLYLYFFSFTG